MPVALVLEQASRRRAALGLALLAVLLVGFVLLMNRPQWTHVAIAAVEKTPTVGR